MKMKTKECVYCKKEFQYKNYIQKFCSSRCKGRHSVDNKIIKVKQEKKVYSIEFFDWRDYDSI